MAYYELITSLKCDVEQVCFNDKAFVISSRNSIIYHQSTSKQLRWFGQKELQPAAMAMNSHFWSVITVDGTLMIFPISSLAEDQFALAWQKFITKGFFTLHSYSHDEGFLEALGSCLVVRDRDFDNHLDVSVMKIKVQQITSLFWMDHLLTVALTQEFWIINSGNGHLERKILAFFPFTAVQKLGEFVLIYSQESYFAVTFEDLYNDRLLNCKKIYWQGNVVTSSSESKVGVTYNERFDVFDLKQAEVPESSFVLPRAYSQCVIWGKTIVGLLPSVSIIGQVSCENKKSVNKNLSRSKSCVCGECWRRVSEVNYEEWIHIDKSSNLLWSVNKEIGNVKAYLTFDDRVEIVTEEGIYCVKTLDADLAEPLISAVETHKIPTAHKLILVAQSRVKDLKAYLQSLISLHLDPIIVFRLEILSKPSPLLVSSQFWGDPNLHTELYNYLWSSYFSLASSSLAEFSILISKLLSSILKFDLHALSGTCQLQPYQHLNSKPLFGRLEIEAGLCYVLPLLVPITVTCPINKFILQIVQGNFNALKTSTQIYLLVLAEQVSLDLPVQRLILTCERLEGCKALRVICKLANIETLFSQYDPVFSQDYLISLLPLHFSRDYSVRTTRIYKKSMQTPPIIDISKLVVCIAEFLSNFVLIFKSTEGFSKHFNSSLSRLLVVFAYALHKLKSTEIYKLFVDCLSHLKGFYDLHQVSLAACALRSSIVLSAIYESKADWVNVLKSKLLDSPEPLPLLFEYLTKVEEEHQKAEMIYSCLLICSKSGCSRAEFLESFINTQYESLTKYIINNY